MHSSRMRSARLLTVSQHALLGGVPTRVGGVPAQGVPAWGVYLPRAVPTRGYYLPGDVPARGYFPRGCTCPGECTCLGVYLPGGVPAQGGVPAWGCTCRRVYLPGGTCLGLPPCIQNDRQVLKYYLAPNFVCGR